MNPSEKNPIQESKALLREKLKKIRDQVDPALAEAASQGIWNILCRLPEFHKAKGIGAFASTPAEINTYPILEGILELGKNLYLPKVVKDKTHFDYYQVQNFKNLSAGSFGILEPSGTHPADWGEIDLALVPGLAFDLKGHRLGFGKGYYDRVLPLLKKSALTVGLGYSFQMVEQVPAEPHDLTLKAVLSEKEFRFCRP
jgi:5-formyltetrahydrofolate cyclo-ligase